MFSASASCSIGSRGTVLPISRAGRWIDSESREWSLAVSLAAVLLFHPGTLHAR